jgi:hypothetical protein
MALLLSAATEKSGLGVSSRSCTRPRATFVAATWTAVWVLAASGGSVASRARAGPHGRPGDVGCRSHGAVVIGREGQKSPHLAREDGNCLVHAGVVGDAGETWSQVAGLRVSSGHVRALVLPASTNREP